MEQKIKYRNGGLVVETDMSIQSSEMESLQQEYSHDGDIIITRNEDSNLEISVGLLNDEPVEIAIERVKNIASRIIESAKSIQDKSKAAETEDIRKRTLENLIKDVKGSMVTTCGLKADNIGVAITIADKESGDMITSSNIHPMVMVNYWVNAMSEEIIKGSFDNSREVN